MELTDVRCFRTATFDLGKRPASRWGTLLLGDNGTGKTSVLRSIALALTDVGGASSLLQELYGEWQHGGSRNEARIRVEFTTARGSHRGKPWFVETIISSSLAGTYEVKQNTFPDPFPWERIFVAGYGAARRVYGTRDYNEYTTLDAVYTLFNYDAPLQNPELALRRLEASKTQLTLFLDRLADVLMLERGSIKLSKTGLSINGPWGEFVPITALGDGYQATLGWLVDLLGWDVLRHATTARKRSRPLTGIVLIDEIDQHLHPRWQRSLIRRLRTQFPYLQFIATTHSPLVAIGLSDLADDDESRLYLLRHGEDGVESVGPYSPPQGQRADQVLTGSLFELATTTDDETKALVEEYARLLQSRDRTPSIEERLGQMERRLEMLLAPETLLERSVADAVDQVLTEKASALPGQAIRYEVRRQLGDATGRAP